MPRPLGLFNRGDNTLSFIALMFLVQMLVVTFPVRYALEIRAVYGFGIRLHGMCEVTPYMKATIACRDISLIYHTLQCYITYIPWHGALIFTSIVVHSIIYRN